MMKTADVDSDFPKSLKLMEKKFLNIKSEYLKLILRIFEMDRKCKKKFIKKEKRKIKINCRNYF